MMWFASTMRSRIAFVATAVSAHSYASCEYRYMLSLCETHPPLTEHGLLRHNPTLPPCFQNEPVNPVARAAHSWPIEDELHMLLLDLAVLGGGHDVGLVGYFFSSYALGSGVGRLIARVARLKGGLKLIELLF